MRKYLGRFYTLTDATDKFRTLLFEVKSKDYPRRLKIEIRKEKKAVKTEAAIAYSKNSNIQVLLKAVSLDDMMALKIETFLDRGEIRDVFDIEFLLKKGIPLGAASRSLAKVLAKIDSFVKTDYSAKLGSLLEEDQRKYYTKENFKILKMAIAEKLADDNSASLTKK